MRHAIGRKRRSTAFIIIHYFAFDYKPFSFETEKRLCWSDSKIRLA